MSHDLTQWLTWLDDEYPDMLDKTIELANINSGSLNVAGVNRVGDKLKEYAQVLGVRSKRCRSALISCWMPMAYCNPCLWVMPYGYPNGLKHLYRYFSAPIWIPYLPSTATSRQLPGWTTRPLTAPASAT